MWSTELAHENRLASSGGGGVKQPSPRPLPLAAFDVTPEDSPAKPPVERGMELLAQVSKEGRNTLLALRTTASSESDLEEALSRLRGEFSLPANVDYRVITDGEAELLRPLIRDEVYLIVREAVINAFRHSKASAIQVKVDYISRNLRVSVRDNGCGSCTFNVTFTVNDIGDQVSAVSATDNAPNSPQMLDLYGDGVF